ncbi:MAG: SAM-dependent methyltransferase [Kiritimatiellia bacterium]
MHAEFKIGSRDSQLAQRQVAEVLSIFAGIVPGMGFDPVWFSSPGDRDQQSDLQAAPLDFFTRDLDDALRDGVVDCALHSAKDFPYPAPAGLDWFWLPSAYDQRDVLVGSQQPSVVGVSSARRRAYAQKRFPDAQLLPLRGTIERRLAQLDAGAFDAVLMAGVALQRLGLADRVAQWISLDDLPTPDGQGSLLFAFRSGDTRFERLRSLFVRPVNLASAGTGADTCSMAAVTALRRAEVCLYDALLDHRLLEHVPAGALKIYVGKRSGRHSHSQDDICELLVRYARMGRRVVRLKGGDAGIYGRLAEEVEALDTLALPYRVLPGVSSVSSATTGTGLLLTRRGVTDRIHILSGHSAAAHHPQGDGSQTEVIFMGTRCLADIVAERVAEGYDVATPIALVWAAGLPEEKVLCGTLADIVETMRGVDAGDAPGLILIGRAIASQYLYRQHGALRGMRVWVTCSADVQDKACAIVRDFGGIPVSLPIITLVPEKVDFAWDDYDWLILTSPAAVRCLLAGEHDVRRLPRILCCGPGTAAVLQAVQLSPDAQPEGSFSTEGVLAMAKAVIEKGARILRVRSDRAGPELAARLSEAGFVVDDVVISRNVSLPVAMPAFDGILFASASAVDAFVAQFGVNALQGKLLGVMGTKEVGPLSDAGVQGIRVPARFTLFDSVATMAGAFVEKEIRV